MTPEFPITKSHLRDQRVIRRGRPSKFGRGIRKLELPISDAVCVALEILAAYELSARPPRTNRESPAAIEYARDALEQSVSDRFQQVFGRSIGDFLRARA